MGGFTELRNHQREIYYFRLRLLICLGFVGVMLGILLVRLFYLQVVRHEHFHTLADSNRIYVVPIVPNRGLLLDRNGIVMARNRSGYTLEIAPAKVADMDALIAELGRLVTLTPKDIRRFRRRLAERQPLDTLPLRTQLTDEEVARVAAQKFRFPAVEIRARLFREYPFSDIASHLIGHVGRINEKDRERLEQEGLASDYRGSDYIGKTGIEQSYELPLHGMTGFEEVEMDAGGRGVRVLSRTPPQSGSTIVLTVDAKLQQVAERALGDYRGALVAIDPSNGEVLAFVSKPGYDPALFVEGIDSETWEELNNSPDTPLNNRALRGQYPPGSTIKPFMALAALHYGVRDPSRFISDPGYFMLPGSTHQYRDWKTGGHGAVDLSKSLAVSCDTYYYGLANEMGIDNMHAYLSRFGFGHKTGLDMEGEASGLLPSPEWKRKRFGQAWYPGDTISAGIGQGYHLVTPLQLAFAVATLANDGVAFQPHLVKEIRPALGAPIVIQPKRLFDLQIDPAHLQLVKSAMEAVTRPGGTAAGAGYGVKYRMAGKTGTAQVITIRQGERYDESKISEYNRDHAWFVAFAPVEQPRIALAVLVENGGHGGSTAAPIARRVLDYYLLGKEPKPLQKVIENTRTEND